LLNQPAYFPPKQVSRRANEDTVGIPESREFCRANFPLAYPRTRATRDECPGGEPFFIARRPQSCGFGFACCSTWPSFQMKLGRSFVNRGPLVMLPGGHPKNKKRWGVQVPPGVCHKIRIQTLERRLGSPVATRPGESWKRHEPRSKTLAWPEQQFLFLHGPSPLGVFPLSRVPEGTENWALRSKPRCGERSRPLWGPRACPRICGTSEHKRSRNRAARAPRKSLFFEDGFDGAGAGARPIPGRSSFGFSIGCAGRGQLRPGSCSDDRSPILVLGLKVIIGRCPEEPRLRLPGDLLSASEVAAEHVLRLRKPKLPHKTSRDRLSICSWPCTLAFK